MSGKSLFRALSVVVLVTGLATPVAAQDGFGVVDTATGEWRLRNPTNGSTTHFFYGTPADLPFVGDWDCNGTETPGLYRQSDGFVYLRNSNSQGVGDIRFFFGDPGDIPLAGDFDGDGCDTVSIYRAAEGRAFIINDLGANEGGLGAADFSYYFGVPGDKPFIGDFDNDSIDELGLHRESTGLVYFRLSHTQGVADSTFIFGDPGDKIIAGSWTGAGADTVGLFRPSNCTMYLRNSNSQGVADATFIYGMPSGLPVAGEFGPLAGGSSAPNGCGAPPPPPPPTAITFGNGTWRIGIDIPAGTYRNSASPNVCYGERVSGFGGTFDEIIANEISESPLIVTISPTDAGFTSERCSLWTNDLSPVTSSQTAPFGEGYFMVVSDIASGLWRNSDSSNTCYWERLSGFSWEFDDLIANGLSDSLQTVQIASSDRGFNSQRCGTWTYLGP